MENPTPSSTDRRKKALKTRVFWFLAGAAINYALIATPFKYLRNHTELPLWVISGCSTAVGTTFFFAWNYFVNFRTEARKRDVLARYCAAVCLMWVISTTVLCILKAYNFHMALSLGRFPIDLDIVATQFFPAGIKFFLYHRWVFPVAAEEPAAAPVEVAAAKDPQ